MNGALDAKGVGLDVKSIYVGLAAGLVCGLGAGVAGGVLYARRHIQAAFNTRLDTAVAGVKADYNKRIKGYLAETGSPFSGPASDGPAANPGGDSTKREAAVGDSSQPGGVHRVAYNQIARGSRANTADVAQHTEAAGAGEDDPRLDGLDDGSHEAADGEDVTSVHNIFDENGSQSPNPVPYGISAGEFAETPEGYQVLSMTFYADDSVLVDDDNNQPIENQMMVAGELTRAGFGSISGQANTRFVRNEKLEVDIEITLNEGSYVHEVLGYGQPG